LGTLLCLLLLNILNGDRQDACPTRLLAAVP
jgi:hypothetical protein